MSTSQNSDDFPDTRVVDSGVNAEAKRELDLIDVIAMLWYARVFILPSLLFGLVLGLTSWFILKTAYRGQAPHPSHWTASIHGVFPKSWTKGASQRFSSFLESELGATAFYSGINSGRKERTLPEDLWIRKQLAGDGMIKSLDVASSEVIVTIRMPDMWNESDIIQTLIPALNNAIRAFNYLESKKFEVFFQENLALQSKLAGLTLKAIGLFDSHSPISSEVKSTIVESVLRDLSQTPKADPIFLLLAGVPDSVVDKSQLVHDYKDYTQRIEFLHFRMGLERGSSPSAFDFTPLQELSSAPALVPLDRLIANKPLPEILNTLPFFLIVGLIIGFLVGISSWLIRSFWQRNGARLHLIFKSIK